MTTLSRLKGTVNAPSTRKQITPFRLAFLHKVDAHFAFLLFYVARSIVVIHHNLDENGRSLEIFFGVLILLVIDGKALEYLCF